MVEPISHHGQLQAVPTSAPGAAPSESKLATFAALIAGGVELDDPIAIRRLVVDGVARVLPADAVELNVFDSDGARLLEHLAGGPAGERLEGDGAGFAAVLEVPLPLAGGHCGTLRALRDEGPFDPGDEATLEALADQALVVVEHSRRLQSEQRQRRLAEKLHDVTAAMTSTLDLTAVLDSLLEGLAHVLEYRTASVVLNQDDRLWVMAASGIPGGPELFQYRPTATGDFFFEELAEHGRPVVVDDWQDRPDRPHYVGGDEVRGWVAVPLTSRGRVIGMLTVGSDQPRGYGREALAIAQAFATQAAVAIQNARLFQRTQVTLAKTETLYSTAQALIGSDSLAEVLQSVVDGAARALPADRVALATVNLNQQRVVHFVRGGPGRARLVALDFDELWDGLGGWALRERTSVLSSGSKPDEREGELAARRRALTEAGATIVAPLRYRGKLFGTLTAVNARGQRDFGHRDLELLEAMANQAAMAIENARLFDEVQRLAVTDDLTRLSNRRGFFELARRELDRAERTGRPATALMLDIDGFKKINDTYGHAVGDQVLGGLADRFRVAVRDVDLVGRYGGEEFAFLLPETDVETALFIADRILTRVSGTPMPTDAGPLTVKVSIGVAAARGGGETVASLLDRADTAMYQAKTGGGNTIQVEALGLE